MDKISMDDLGPRDYFASQALIGNLSRCQPGYEFTDEKSLAEMCYKQADAMLSARQQGERT